MREGSSGGLARGSRSLGAPSLQRCRGIGEGDLSSPERRLHNLAAPSSREGEWQEILNSAPTAGGSARWRSALIHPGAFVYRPKSDALEGLWGFRLALSLP